MSNLEEIIKHLEEVITNKDMPKVDKEKLLEQIRELKEVLEEKRRV